MARGAKTGGRTKGTPNKRTAEMVAKVEASGLTPLDYMLSILRDQTNTPDMRMDAAKNAAPYVHPRLAAVEHSGGLEITTHEAALNELDDGEGKEDPAQTP